MSDPQPNQAQVTVFWQQYLATLPDEHPHHEVTYTAWGFGATARQFQALGELAARGIKQATASLYDVYNIEDEPLPQVGELSIIIGGEGQPLCLIETTRLDIVPFDEVTEEFAYTEGEGDKSLAYWREAHIEFFTEELKNYGLTFHHDMPIVCERFSTRFSIYD